MKLKRAVFPSLFALFAIFLSPQIVKASKTLTINLTNKLIGGVAVHSLPLTVVVVAKVAKTHCSACQSWIIHWFKIGIRQTPISESNVLV
jgi:hypothetical protein